MGLNAIPQATVALIGSAYFIGWSATLLWAPRLGDIYGRKKIYTIGMIVDLFIFISLFVINNVYVMMANQFIFGALSSFRVNVGYVYMQELCPRSGRILIGTCWNIGEGLVYLTITIYFWVTNYGSWVWLVVAGLVM